MNENIEFWAGIWRWVFILGGGAYLLLMLYIIIVGPMDIIHLYRSLREMKETEDAMEGRGTGLSVPRSVAPEAKDEEEKAISKGAKR